jgi:integrase
MIKATYKFIHNRLNRLREDGTALIHLEICLGVRQRFISTGLKVAPEDWSGEPGNWIKKSCENYDLMNNELRAKLHSIDSYELDQRRRGRQVTITQLVNYLKNKEQKTFLAFFEFDFIGKKKAEGSTIKQYYSTLSHLKKYGKIIEFDDLTYESISEFNNYLYSLDLMDQTVHTLHKRTKSCVREAMKYDYIIKNPYEFFPMPKLRKNKIRYLTADEVRRIEEKKFSSKRLTEIKDVFLFSCYTGLSFSDVAKLTAKDIKTEEDGTKWIIQDRTKTKNEATVYLMPKALAIIKKYKGGEKLLPVKSNQRTNEYLKEIQGLCDIDKTLTFHMSRHTCGTILVNNKVPMAFIAKTLGHKDLRTTAQYAKVIDEQMKETMKQIEDKI